MHRIWPLDASQYQPHALHCGRGTWLESNCFVDLWIELLHSAGHEPLAALPCTIAIDWEGDQWTFFKFPLADLTALYGIDVIELNIWRPLVAHTETQVALGRPVIVEVDGFYLPDTAGTTYRRDHVKTSIAVQAIDTTGRRLGYFHNAGYYELAGGDFTGLFRLEAPLAAADILPPYVEVAKLHAAPAVRGECLVTRSLALLAGHLSRRPSGNPVRRYADRFAVDLEWLAGAPLDTFHAYAFATLRQCGAAFELAGAYVRWLRSQGEDGGLDAAAAACDTIAETAKALQFKVARAVHVRRPFDATPLFDTMAAAWEEALGILVSRYADLAQHS
jgi:hypothetical protein